MEASLPLFITLTTFGVPRGRARKAARTGRFIHSKFLSSHSHLGVTRLRQVVFSNLEKRILELHTRGSVG